MLSPYGVTERGFHKKNCYADIAKILNHKEDLIIFDVGAYDGDTADIFATIFPNANIYCFEPTPDLFNSLKMKYSGNNNIQVFDYAVTDNNERETEFYQFSEGATNSLLPMTKDANRFTERLVEPKGRISVPSITLEEFCHANDIRKIDILKSDTQGAELRVLYGATKLLKDKQISLLLTELIFVNLYENQANHYEVAQLLDTYGYSLFDYYNFAYDDKTGQLKWGDAIFLPDSE
jgi:FkbM family methyltransferase